MLLPHLLKDSLIIFRVVSQTPQILYNGIVSSSSLFKDRAVFLNHQASESRAILLNDITLHWTDSAVFLNPHAYQRTALLYWITSPYFEQIVQCFWIMPFKGQRCYWMVSALRWTDSIVLQLWPHLWKVGDFLFYQTTSDRTAHYYCDWDVTVNISFKWKVMVQ